MGVLRNDQGFESAGGIAVGRNQTVKAAELRGRPELIAGDLDREQADAAGFLRLSQTALGVFQCFAGQVLGRAVTQDLDEADMRVVVVSQRHHLARGPEPPFAFTQVPPLVRGAPVTKGGRHLISDPSAGPVFGREEAGRVLAAHLLGGPAHHVLRPGVPGRDAALAISDHDGEVERAVENGTLTGLVQAGAAILGSQPPHLSLKLFPRQGT